MTRHPLLPHTDRGWLTPYVYFSNNALSLTGVVLVTTATVLWLFLLPATLRTEVDNPYLGILAFLLLPAMFFLGLVLIPLGVIRLVRRKRASGELPARLPPLDLHTPQLARLLLFVGVTTCVNVVIGGQLTYRAVDYMEGVTFCGRTCHDVMQPEYTAYQNSPHSRVECVKCHIGPGASWFVKSKISGAYQVVATTLQTYPRPIPVPVANLRPARETCEQCHWPQKYGSDRLRVIRKFAADERNTESKTVLLMKIGGGGEPGIHGTHVGNGTVIRYRHTDRQRQKIKWVEISRRGEEPVRYTASAGENTQAGGDAATGSEAEAPAGGIRQMDCMDCHNRPTHTFDLPEGALDKAMASGAISPAIPWVKKHGLELLQTKFASRLEAEQSIPERLEAVYKQQHPKIYADQAGEIRKAGAALAKLYLRNVFPAMKVTWGTYPNNIGHEDFPGCFRCHDEMHKSPDGAGITQDCDVCHQLLAMEEEKPEILDELGFSQ